MADETPAARVRGANSDQRASPSEVVVSSADRTELLAQATRFLTSAKISESATDADKSDFLRSKGLTEEEIAQAVADSHSPADTGATNRAPATQTGDEDPFERAARQFDDPIHADSLSPPPKSYPKSPLALYYDAPAQQQHHAAGMSRLQTEVSSPLTRYQVLLRFFRTLSFMMMLGGGATALLVSAYRVYILPKITATFDARSIVLRHHITLFDKLRHNVGNLAMYMPKETLDVKSAQDASSNGVSARKGVLKKVHFNDHSAQKADMDEEGVKATQHDDEAKKATTTEKVITPGTDVVIDSATAPAKPDSAVDSEPQPVQLAPIDLTEPIRSSLAKLAESLRANMTSATTSTSTNTDRSTSHARAARSTTVQDASSGSDDWEDDEEEDEEASDDGLEFDPYGAYQKKLKHTQATTTATAAAKTPASLTGLKGAIASLNADISTHSFAATSSSSNMFSSSYRYMPGGTAGATGDGSSSSGTDSPKFGDLGQVKAEIRSLKGLLLSRRNFPSYSARPPPPPLPSSTSSDLRPTSAVV